MTRNFQYPQSTFRPNSSTFQRNTESTKREDLLTSSDPVNLAKSICCRTEQEKRTWSDFVDATSSSYDLFQTIYRCLRVLEVYHHPNITLTSLDARINIISGNSRPSWSPLSNDLEIFVDNLKAAY